MTEKQMQKANKEMPTRKELQSDREGTIKKMENIAKKYATKVIKPETKRVRKKKTSTDDDYLPF